MNIFKKMTIVIFLSVCILSPKVASALGLEIAGGLWSQSPSGNFSYQGIALDMKNDLKYDSKIRLFGRAKINTLLILPNIYFMITPIKFDGAGSKNVNFTFDKYNFSANVPIISEITFDQYDFAFYYGLPFLKKLTLDRLNIDIGINAKIISLNIDIKQSTTNLSASKALSLPIPMIYTSIQVRPIQNLVTEVELRGITYRSNSFYDIIGRAKYTVNGPLFVGAGYRSESIKIDEDNLKADFKFSGPFAEVGVNF